MTKTFLHPLIHLAITWMKWTVTLQPQGWCLLNWRTKSTNPIKKGSSNSRRQCQPHALIPWGRDLVGHWCQLLLTLCLFKTNHSSDLGVGTYNSTGDPRMTNLHLVAYFIDQQLVHLHYLKKMRVSLNPGLILRFHDGHSDDWSLIV